MKRWFATPTHDANPYSVALNLEDVLPLISSKTRLVAFTACSNILGSIIPVKQFTAAIRQRAAEQGAQNVEISVDCVAYAPHRRIDVQDWDVDFCVFSYYKVQTLRPNGVVNRFAEVLFNRSMAHISLPSTFGRRLCTPPLLPSFTTFSRLTKSRTSYSLGGQGMK